jgi:hypothetical protein
MKFELTKSSLVLVAARELAKDFGTKDPGNYSMTIVPQSLNPAMLYVTDQSAHKAIAYKVDIFANTMVPMTPVDLNAAFPG